MPIGFFCIRHSKIAFVQLEMEDFHFAADDSLEDLAEKSALVREGINPDAKQLGL